MRKKVLSFIVAIAAIASGASYAQSNNKSENGKQKIENCRKNKDGKKKCGECADYFKGIQLTADQQEKLKVLRQGLGPVEFDKKQNGEKSRMTAEEKKQLKAERKAKKLEAKKKYLDGVKGILAPDQYVMFLENVYIYGQAPKHKAFYKNKDMNRKKQHDKKDKMAKHGNKRDKNKMKSGQKV